MSLIRASWNKKNIYMYIYNAILIFQSQLSFWKSIWQIHQSFHPSTVWHIRVVSAAYVVSLIGVAATCDSWTNTNTNTKAQNGSSHLHIQLCIQAMHLNIIYSYLPKILKVLAWIVKLNSCLSKFHFTFVLKYLHTRILLYILMHIFMCSRFAVFCFLL